VIVVRHAHTDPLHGGAWRQDELRADDFVIVREREHGSVVDETIMPERVAGWTAVRFVLDGPLAVRGADLHAGDVVLTSTYGDAPARTLEHRMDTLTLIWRADSAIGSALASADVMRPSPRAARSLVNLAERLAVDDTSIVTGAAFDAFDALRAAGVPLANVRDMRASMRSATAGEHEIARVLGRVMCSLASQPMAIDLARGLGVCERQALRRVNAFFARYYRTARSWRDYVSGMRVLLGTFFIAQPAATTEHVASLLGFASATSFCHAFQDAGLPSPLAVQRSALS
jgi:hypothetical protein